VLVNGSVLNYVIGVNATALPYYALPTQAWLGPLLILVLGVVMVSLLIARPRLIYAVMTIPIPIASVLYPPTVSFTIPCSTGGATAIIITNPFAFLNTIALIITIAGLAYYIIEATLT
jgi:hypothetical protein